MSITEKTTIAEITAQVPASVRVFQRYGIDFCCGGKRSVGVVCRDQGVSFTELTQAIEGATAQPVAGDRDWLREPLPVLIDHIVTTYHNALRDELPQLAAMAAKVASVHGAKASFLEPVAEHIRELSTELTAHMGKEEHVLFPAIRARGQDRRAAGWIAAPIAVMEREHDRAGELLAELRLRTGGYVVPAWGCGTLRALYRGLEKLEADMHIHVHLENNVLFPRALRAAGVAGDHERVP
jgi:regulator of cell morphogenesis and NO signaling